VFDRVGATEDLIVSLSFLPGLTDRQIRVVHRWLRAMEASPERADPDVSPFAAVEPFVHEYLFHARIGNLRDPRAAVRALLAELNAAGVRIRDSFYACWEWRPTGVMGPRRDPRAPAEATGITSPREYLDRLWDPRSAPPPSEVEADLKGGFVALDELVLEHRGAPLYLPGFRIGYGTVPFDHAPPDRRTDEVRRVVVDALAEGWRSLFKAPGKGHTRPQPLDADGVVDRVSRITCGTRVGYLFAIESVQLLDRPSPRSCRFREYELMEAVTDAVGRLGLAPVVTWQRFGTPAMMGPIRRPDTVDVQLWEAGGDHTSHRGLDVPWPINVVGIPADSG
jgi:hypothetical protein